MHKTCFKCGRTLPLESYYKHPRMADGHLNKCKECAQSDTMQNRRRNSEYYRRYDRQRSNLPHRVAACEEYQQKQRVDEPHKQAARNTARNAVRDGRLRREPCYFCGGDTDLEMHHPDYSQPLRVYWLCRLCHRKLDGMTKLGMETVQHAR